MTDRSIELEALKRPRVGMGVDVYFINGFVAHGKIELIEKDTILVGTTYYKRNMIEVMYRNRNHD